MPEQIRDADESKIADMMRYASALVTIGVDPDNPAAPRIDIVQQEGRRRICLATQAAMLRHLADKLDAAHGPGRC